MLTTSDRTLVSESVIEGLLVSRCYRLDPAAVEAMTDAEVDAVRTVLASSGIAVSMTTSSLHEGCTLLARVIDRNGEIVKRLPGHGMVFVDSTTAKRFALEQGYLHEYESTSLRAVRS